MICIGFETSCDETSVCILKNRDIIALKTFSQIDLHKEYGGVVPEIASRSHIEIIRKLTLSLLKESNIGLNDIDLVCVTSEPGLIGGLLVGIVYAKTLAYLIKKPIVFVNHLEGHMLTTGLTDNINEDSYVLLASGGHTQMLLLNKYPDYKLVGQTIDDSVGECFDKVGKMMGLDYPAGPKIESLAKLGNADRFKFKIPMKGKDKYNFSFSGLKTFFLREYQKIPQPNQQDLCDISASLQKIIGNILTDRVQNMFINYSGFDNFVLCGGVSANLYLRKCLEDLCIKFNKKAFFAPLYLCGDNAAMIAYVGLLKYQAGLLKNQGNI